MSKSSLPLPRLGVLIGFWSIILLAMILFFVYLLPQFLSAGYKDVGPLLRPSQNLVTWAFPILQISLAAGVAMVMAAPRSTKVLPWGIALLSFTACAFLWPSVIYLLNLSNSWLAGGLGGFGHPTIIPSIQAWLFSGMLLQLATWCQSKSSNIHSASTKDSESIDDWRKPVSGLRFVLWAGGLLLASWLVLYYLPIVIPKLSQYYIRFFRILLFLPQIGMFLLMLLLGVFAGRVSPISKLLKNFVIQPDSDHVPTESGTVKSRTGSSSIIAWTLFGLVALSIGSYIASQRTLAQQYASKQLEKTKVVLEDFNRKFQEANKELVSSIGTQAPNIQLETLQGESMTLESLKGKVVLLNFWETKNVASTIEIQSLERIFNDLSDEGIAVIGISPEPKQTLESFLRSKNVTYTIVSGSKLQPPFDRLTTKPITYVIDRDGIIRVRLVGIQGYTKLKAAVQQATLTESKPTNAENQNKEGPKDPQSTPQ